MAESVVREVWLDAKGNPVAPNTPGATRHRIRFDPDGNKYQQNWIPAKPTGGFWEGGPGSTPPGPNDGTWSAFYWVDKDEPEKDSPVAANTSAPLIVTRKADGTLGKDPNPNYIAPKAPTPEEIAKDQANADYYNAYAAKIIAETPTGEEREARLALLRAQIVASQASAANAGASAAAAADAAQKQLEWEKYWEPYKFGKTQEAADAEAERKYGWNREERGIVEQGLSERRRQDAEDAMRRQRLTSAVGLSGNIAQATQAAIPYAALPGQTHFLGADLAEKMSGRIGIPYRRDDFQSQMIPFDGLQAWRLAQGALGVK